MSDRYVYLLVDIACICVPLIASFHPKIKFYRYWRYSLPAIAITSLLFLVWDAAFTGHGVWSFNGRYVLGYYVASLPLEEVLFFICIPYACLFIFYCVDRFVEWGNNKVANITSWLLAAALIVVGFTHLQQLYTSVTFISLGILLIVLAVKKVGWLSDFYISFLLALLPFFISNGILTGTGLAEPVVRYNNNYNLGIRILTIPVEDIFYGMLFQLMNVCGFVWLRKVFGTTAGSMNTSISR